MHYLNRFAGIPATLLLLSSTADAQNNALQFDGSNDRVQVALPTIFGNPAANSFSASLWLRPDGSATQRVFFAQKNVNEFATILLSGGNVPFFYVRTTSGQASVTTAGSLPTGQWSHLAVSWDAASSTARMFIGGSEVATTAGGSSSTGIDGMLTLGSRTDGAQPLNGALDGFRLWSTALTPAQVRAEALSTCGAGAPLVASWDFDVGTAGGDNTGLTTLPDGSGAGYDGTLLNFALTGGTSNWIASPVTRTAPALVFDPPLPPILSTGEDGSGYTGTVVLAAPPAGDVSVSITSSNPAEGVATPAALTFAADQWNVPQAVSIVGVDDAVIDGPVVYNVSFAVQATDACYGALSFDLGASNADDDFTTVAVSGVAGPEGDAGSSAFTFDLTLADPVPGGVSVTYGTVDGTAHAGTDYVATSGSVTFAGVAGEVQQVSVPIIGNLVAQGDRTFSLHALASSNPQVMLDPDQADGVIVDDDVDVGVSLDDGVVAVTPGQALVYQLVVGNHSPTLGAGTVHVTFGSAPALDAVSWTCIGVGGATCAPSGSGTLDESIVLPAGGSAAFAISAHAPEFDGVPLVASAQATLSGGIVDSQPGDNQAADVDAGPAGIFTDGFDGN
ncbi:hypothetical protein FHW12_001350 [Dokdonella fugitiva]|uniref:Calx-beta domain-containing protein n=1 Tax=Dokdonella fugitiva TaxID=328517 RepID=A0A839EXL8_9GAMM|nr:LamG-like jellyroll fold domain-containing protein [Dokdonella fugitiva]MBA8887136.1 hypothetical protein [Dokdonella fugitiva]